jgi:hypothetical protein
VRSPHVSPSKPTALPSSPAKSVAQGTIRGAKAKPIKNGQTAGRISPTLKAVPASRRANPPQRVASDSSTTSTSTVITKSSASSAAARARKPVTTATSKANLTSVAAKTKKAVPSTIGRTIGRAQGAAVSPKKSVEELPQKRSLRKRA